MTTGNMGFELIMRDGVDPARVVGKKVPPPPEFFSLRENGLHIERNVPVHMRDGVRLYVDIYRPDGALGQRALPTLLGWSPYGKHNTSSRLAWPAAGVQDGWMSPYTAFEAPDPMYWCARGYAVVYPDPRGSWYSEGELRHGGLGEAEDCFDLIQFLGECAWSNGKVGMWGCSATGGSQMQALSTAPPSLKAIFPMSCEWDVYAFVAAGGITPHDAPTMMMRGGGHEERNCRPVRDDA